MFKALSYLKTKEAPKPWDICKLFPGKSPKEIAEECVQYFSSISKDYPPLPDPKTEISSEEWQLMLHEVAQKLKCCKKPKSIVEGDLPPKLVTMFADILAVPLLCIYNKVLSTKQWPRLWKQETVKIIPKKKIPESISDLRNISCTPLFSKVLEQFVLTKLRQEISLSDNQFGGAKGVGIDHFLCETWHEILMNLEDTEAASSLISVDFSKAFDRMNHFACLDSLRSLGAEENTVRVVHAFLFGRKMAVHIKGEISSLHDAPGGAPQGSVLGSHLFCATTEKLNNAAADFNQGEETRELEQNGEEVSLSDLSDDNALADPIAPPYRASTPLNFDRLEISSGESSESEEDIERGIRRPSQRLLDSTIMSQGFSQTILEEVLQMDEWQRETPSVKAYIDDYNVIEKVRTTNAVSHFTEQLPTYEVHAPQSQKVFKNVKKAAGEIGMMVNDSKTQLLCIHPKGNKMKTFIKPSEESGKLKSGENLKILGFTFYLWSMRHLKRSGMEREDLLSIYKSVMRPTIDFASVSYNSLLTKEQSLNIERLQMKSMKIIYGENVAYSTVINEKIIEPLQARREEAVKKFAIKISKNSRFKKWLPTNREIGHALRRREKYYVPKLKTERGMKSPILQIRRLLNSIN